MLNDPLGLRAEGRGQFNALQQAEIFARLDRLPATRYIWQLVSLISLGGFFEIYDLLLNAPLGVGLLKAGIFHRGSGGLFGVNDQATFVATTFAGLYVGTLCFSFVADRLGRRPIFIGALFLYAVTTVVMGFQKTAAMVDLFRFIASIGIGMQLVAIDCYLAEMAPAHLRGVAFSVSASIQFLSAPLVAILAWRLLPNGWLGLDGWRWLAFFPGLALVLIWWIRRALPESPRWLVAHGQGDEAEKVTAAIEGRVARDYGRELPAPAMSVIAPEADAKGAFADLWRSPYRRRTITLAVFHFFQAIGYFGFNSWLPLLLLSQGVTLGKTLAYSIAISLAPSLTPAIFSLVSDRLERKWLIVAGALMSASCGLALARMTQASSELLFIALGVGVAAANTVMSFTYHTYQSELFPTRIRARAVGFVYSFSRLSALLSSYLIAYILDRSGSVGVFTLLAGAMVVVAIAIGGFGPRTRGRPLEAI